MKTRKPTSKEIEELVSFSPRLYAEDFEPIKEWQGGAKKEGVFTAPWPIYEDIVEEFFKIASSECWADYDYIPNDAHRMLEDEGVMQTADLDQIKTMLTFCVRGERFSDGHWKVMIEKGYILRLLFRLVELNRDNF